MPGLNPYHYLILYITIPNQGIPLVLSTTAEVKMFFGLSLLCQILKFGFVWIFITHHLETLGTWYRSLGFCPLSVSIMLTGIYL